MRRHLTDRRHAHPFCHDLDAWARSWPGAERVVVDDAFTATRPLPHTIEPEVDPSFPPRCAVQVPPRALVKLPNARIRGQEGLVILPSGHFAGELVARDEQGCRSLLRDVPAYYRPLPKRTVRRSGNYYAFLGLGFNHYYHWTHDLIMGMRGVEHLLPEDTQLLVPETMRPFQTETLELLGLRGRPLVPFPQDACWELENLYVVTPRMKTNLDSREPYVWFRDAAMRRYGVSQVEPTRRLYLSRARDDHWRTTNEPEVEALLQEYGFETVTPARFSFREQIELFAQAEVIVGTGAGLFNMVFSSPRTKILQFQDSGHIVHALWTAAGALGLEYHYVVCESVPNPGRDADLRVPLEKLERSLQVMDVA
jgi:hypothetical protein